MEAGELVDRAGEDVAALLARGFDPADTAEAAELIRRLEVVGRRVHAAQAELLAAVDRAGLHRHDGHSSAKAMVRHVAQLSGAEAARRARSAAVLRDLPEAAGAHRRGELGTCQVRRLGRLHANRRVRPQMPVSEAHFLSWARDGSFKEFDELVGGWERLVDEDGAGDAEARGQARRDVTWLQNLDGSWTLDGRSPSLTGAEVADVLRHYTKLERQRDWAEARDRLGDAATAADLRRTEAQRRHDAFVAMCRQAAGAGPTSDGGRSGIVTNVVVDERSFERQLRRLAGDDPGPVDPHDPGWRCSTIDGAPVDPTAATLAALFGEVRRVVIGADSTVVDLGRRRLFTGAAALAVRLAGSECMWPGCHVPVSDCQIDHLQPWAQGGATAPGNGGGTCGRHNLFKQNHGWRTWREADGNWRLRRPDGTTVEGPHRDPPRTSADQGRSPPPPESLLGTDTLDDGGLAAG